MDGIIGDDIAQKGRMEIDFSNGVFGLSFD
jgi:hypothetical protein